MPHYWSVLHGGHDNLVCVMTQQVSEMKTKPTAEIWKAVTTEKLLYDEIVCEIASRNVKDKQMFRNEGDGELSQPKTVA